MIAARGKATVTRVLDGFGGWLMSDGWFFDRGYPPRLRCWAHLLRKTQELIEGDDADGRRFGRMVHTTLETLMAAIYAAREGPPPDAAARDLPRTHAVALAALRQACLDHLGHRHEKTKALAVEFYTDRDAIFNVLKCPHVPLTNNDAERALRHWVIARRLSHGTRTAVGSCVFTLLARVIETCRQRGHSPWNYLATAIADRRAGLPLPPLPQPAVCTSTRRLICGRASRSSASCRVSPAHRAAPGYSQGSRRHPGTETWPALCDLSLPVCSIRSRPDATGGESRASDRRVGSGCRVDPPVRNAQGYRDP